MAKTKEELKEYIKELEQKLENCKHLASAVEAKDAEIIDLKNKYNANLLKEVEKYKVNFEKQEEELTTRLKSEKEMLIERHKREMEEALKHQEEYVNYIKFLRSLVDRYKTAHEAFLKNIQGSLESAVELNAYIAKEIK